jgi:hypothetical protein
MPSPESTATSERAPRSPHLAAVLAWLVPGAGHVYLGRRPRGAAFFALVLLSLIIGCTLDGNLDRQLGGSPLTTLRTLACMGMGLPYFLLRFAVGYSGDILAAGYEYGSAFILSAGLMNLLLVLDAWDIARGAKD